MKLWRFHDPSDERFAAAGLRGSWSPPRGGVCPECGASRQIRVQPLLLVWEPGSDEIGDFSWPGFDSEVVVKDGVLQMLGPRVSGFEPGPGEVIQDIPPLPARGRKRRVPFPYRGPALHELWVTRRVHLDRDRSSMELERTCSTCSSEFWELYGVERWDSHFDAERGQLLRTKIERLPGAGVSLRHADLAGAGIFRVHEFPAWVFCTDDVRQLIEESRLSNVLFLEMGDTF